MDTTIAFIGLGNMGRPMAKNLLKAGYQLRVYNRTRAKAEELAKEGALVALAGGGARRHLDHVFSE